MPPCTTSSCLPSCHGQEEVDRDCSSRIACAVCTLRALCAGACQFCALIPGCAGIPLRVPAHFRTAAHRCAYHQKTQRHTHQKKHRRCFPPGKSSGIQKPHNEPHHQLCGKPSSPGTPGPSGRNRGYARGSGRMGSQRYKSGRRKESTGNREKFAGHGFSGEQTARLTGLPVEKVSELIRKSGLIPLRTTGPRLLRGGPLTEIPRPKKTAAVYSTGIDFPEGM